MHFIEYCASERLQINERVPAGRATEQDKRGEECSDWMSFHIDLWVGVRLFVRVIMLCYALALQHEYMTLISRATQQINKIGPEGNILQVNFASPSSSSSSHLNNVQDLLWLSYHFHH